MDGGVIDAGAATDGQNGRSSQLLGLAPAAAAAAAAAHTAAVVVGRRDGKNAPLSRRRQQQRKVDRCNLKIPCFEGIFVNCPCTADEFMSFKNA